MTLATSLETPKRKEFKTYLRHRKLGGLLRPHTERQPGQRDTMELVRLDVVAGAVPSSKPPVRIFLGTESDQYRAERVFIWSILQTRDPTRIYEIYLMKDIEGFDRRSWKTGFTNYRYAIPTWAEGEGRAIYNDTDQIYLSDPAELFDTDMAAAGVLAVDGRDTSVMLIDCEKMIAVWHFEDARQGKRHRHFREAMHNNDLWGQLPAVWNARDAEYVPGTSRLLHFTTLQTQPWRPFPRELRYRPNPDGEVWFDLEREADAARFTAFTKERPSRRFGELLEQYRILHQTGERNLELVAEETFNGKSLSRHIDDIADLARRHGASDLLDYGCGKALFYAPVPDEPETSRLRRHPQLPGVTITCYDPGYEPFAATYEGPFGGVVSTDVLEHIPEEDIGWVLNEIFGAARKFVYLVAACYPARKTLPNGENAHCTLCSAAWWRGQMEVAARQYPNVQWTLCTVEKARLGKHRRLHHGQGNPS
jgi:hypothetical protein